MKRLLLQVWAVVAVGTAAASEPPEDFPRFTVPGYEREMGTLRQLFWLHYPGASPRATLWDEWLCGPAMWPAVLEDGRADRFRAAWDQALSSRILDAEGYVATHQHASVAYPHGWPFPFFNQGIGSFGWLFSFRNMPGPPWRQTNLDGADGWELEGFAPVGIGDWGWKLQVIEPNAAFLTPPGPIDTYQCPFLQIRWMTSSVEHGRPFVEWDTIAEPRYGPDRRMYFDAPDRTGMVYSIIPLYRHPKWTGDARQLRVDLGNPRSGGTVTLQALFSTYDTRHNINAQAFIRGAARYYWWTGDRSFLARNITRMRNALHFVMSEHHTRDRKVILTEWVGHDGRAGWTTETNGTRRVRSGHGIGNNYWDLLPFGHLDAYATIHYYDTLRVMSLLEREIRAHPEWAVPMGGLAFDPEELDRHADEVRTEGNRLFWNDVTGRFGACVDADGILRDYGFTFLNLEAVHYGFADPPHATSIMQWMGGERFVEGDTAVGDDLYAWRFGPRATTRRNTEWYMWVWNQPDRIPFGDQVQDGGAVLGFSYYDLMARLMTFGPDDAWARLREIIRWFDEVTQAGGYRAYYNGSRPGRLQGGGTAGGLGMDREFFESVLVPQVMLDGFMGFRPAGDGFMIEPRLPRDWPGLTIDRIRIQDRVLEVEVTPETIEVRKESGPAGECFVHLERVAPEVELLSDQGEVLLRTRLARRSSDGALRMDWKDQVAGVRWRRQGE